MQRALDRLYDDYDRLESAVDPIHVVRRYTDPADLEVVGFLAASLAFGQVRSVLRSLDPLLASIDGSPSVFVRTFDPTRDGHRLTALGHRWVRGVDIVALLWVLRQMLDAAGSLEAFFLVGYDRDAHDIVDALESFCSRARGLDLSAAYGRTPRHPGVRYFFPLPSKGSACKRLNLFLRWMIRQDTLDFGVWSQISRAKLIVPLDTHVIRVGQCLELTRYRSPGWAMAAEITASLRDLDPDDPVKYDFALCHLGMTGACGFMDSRKDTRCPLRGCCQPDGRRAPASGRPSGRR